MRRMETIYTHVHAQSVNTIYKNNGSKSVSDGFKCSGKYSYNSSTTIICNVFNILINKIVIPQK